MHDDKENNPSGQGILFLSSLYLICYKIGMAKRRIKQMQEYYIGALTCSALSVIQDSAIHSAVELKRIVAIMPAF